MSTIDSRRILLYHPLGASSKACSKKTLRLTSVSPPLGLATMAAYLIERGITVAILDAYAQPDEQTADGRMRTALLKDRPGWLGISCTTALFNDGVRVARLARATLPGIRVVFGGPHVSALKESLLARYPEIDVLVVGEGEQTTAELLERGMAAATEIAGLVVRDRNGQAVFTGPRALALTLDALPFPAYDKLEGFPDVYNLPLFSYPRRPAVPMISSRGCPYACAYCDRSIFGQSYRTYSSDYVYRHMAFLKQRYGVRHVTFYDDQFTYDRARIEHLCARLTAEPLRMTFNCAVRAEHIDVDLMATMKRAGCWTVSLGVETGDAETLAGHRKNPDMVFMAEQIRRIKKAGMRVKALLMMGLPGESEAAIRRSMTYVFALPLDEIGIARFTPFPGSALYKRVHDLGAFDEDWDKMDCLNFQFVPSGMTHAQLERLFTLFYRRYFMRPATLARYAAMIWRSPDSWKRFWLNAGSFGQFAFGKR